MTEEELPEDLVRAYEANKEKFQRTRLPELKRRVFAQIEEQERIAKMVSPPLTSAEITRHRRVKRRIENREPLAAFGGGEGGMPLHLLRPLGETVWPSPIVWEHPVARSDTQVPQPVKYDLAITAGSIRCLLTDIPADLARPASFQALLGREASLITIGGEDPRFAPLAAVTSGDFELVLSAWSAENDEVGSLVVPFTVRAPSPPRDHYWRQRARLEERHGRVLEALTLLEQITHPVRRDLDIFELLSREVERLQAEQIEAVGPRQQLIHSLLARLKPLRDIYEKRLDVGTEENKS